MPSKIQLDENLWFLYICLQKSDLKTIDFNAVGQATSLKAPAARMRYTRLRRQIESGTLIGTHGTPFASSAVSEKIAKRKRSNGKEKEKEKIPEDKGRDEDAEGDVEDMDVSKEQNSVEAVLGEETETKVKKEEESDGFRSEGDTEGGESDETDSWSSEDEIPLAKLRKRKQGITLTPGVSSQSNDAGRAEREGAPVPELGQETQSHIQHQPRFRQMSRLQEMNGMQQQHYPYPSGMAFGFTPPAMRMYNPAPHYGMHASLPSFGENFGQVYTSPYQGEWGQFEDTRVRWNNGMDPSQG